MNNSKIEIETFNSDFSKIIEKIKKNLIFNLITKELGNELIINKRLGLKLIFKNDIEFQYKGVSSYYNELLVLYKNNENLLYYYIFFASPLIPYDDLFIDKFQIEYEAIYSDIIKIINKLHDEFIKFLIKKKQDGIDIYTKYIRPTLIISKGYNKELTYPYSDFEYYKLSNSNFIFIKDDFVSINMRTNLNPFLIHEILLNNNCRLS